MRERWTMNPLLLRASRQHRGPCETISGHGHGGAMQWGSMVAETGSHTGTEGEQCKWRERKWAFAASTGCGDGEHGQRVVSGSGDKTIRLWNTHTRRKSVTHSVDMKILFGALHSAKTNRGLCLVPAMIRYDCGTQRPERKLVTHSVVMRMRFGALHSVKTDGGLCLVVVIRRYDFGTHTPDRKSVTHSVDMRILF